MATAALLLTACGGDDGVEEEIPGVDAAGESPADGPDGEDETPPPQDDGIERPEIELPDEVTNVFEEVATDDPVELAVLADHERRVNSLDEAIVTGDLERPALGFYSSGEALTSAVEWVESLIENDESFTGTTRYYDREVTVDEEAGRATVRYCIDASESLTTVRSTGEVDPDSGVTVRVHYLTQLDRNEAGVWQTTEAVADPETNRC
ncbi:hypothetical protein FH609_019885 [Streptomyces sp. 3MP-14]|uniref:Uncharacterized protein n=1 Tax=Streptomyces mimosae TaxID=2586635 RepID=A0A5N5ZQW1_9ACTN|nr:MULTISPECIES: hypothetical protein [Streptomyces]KAB8158901.1 hypothetical protein FH607_028815 [Streptomyces mimosae]KAB8174859.1 hypothetical protein FH609_019885 [Streptomyces sp. 3MP-14]